MPELRTVASKIPSPLYAQLMNYCEKEGISSSSFIKRLIEAELPLKANEPSPIRPHNKAGRNITDYDKDNDHFTWTIKYDDGEILEVARNLSPDFIQDLIKSMNEALKTRDLYMNKSSQEAVPAPTRIRRMK